MNRRGKLIVISAPSGCGKSTVIKRILAAYPEFVYSVSTTTRPPRRYEIEGKDYNFIDETDFKRRIERNEFVEWSEVHGNYYGTERAAIQSELDKGHHVLLDIDVNGGEVIQRLFPESILIFLEPPSVEELRSRLYKRGTDDEASIKRRLSRFPMEKEKGRRYPHQLVNDDLELTIKQVIDLINSDDISNGDKGNAHTR